MAALVEGRLAGRIALVTGAANGIGRASAIRLAREGADLALVDREGDRMAALRNLQGIRVLVVDDQTDNRDVIAAIIQRCGGEVTCTATAASGFDLVLLVAAGLDEAPRSCVGHEDLAGLAKRRAWSVCHARHVSGSAVTARGRPGQVARGFHLDARFLGSLPRPSGARP